MIPAACLSEFAFGLRVWLRCGDVMRSSGRDHPKCSDSSCHDSSGLPDWRAVNTQRALAPRPRVRQMPVARSQVASRSHHQPGDQEDPTYWSRRAAAWVAKAGTRPTRKPENCPSEQRPAIEKPYETRATSLPYAGGGGILAVLRRYPPQLANLMTIASPSLHQRHTAPCYRIHPYRQRSRQAAAGKTCPWLTVWNHRGC